MTNESTLAVVASVWGPRRGPAVRAADRPDAPHPLVAPVLRRLVRGAEHRLLPSASYSQTMGNLAVAIPNVVADTVGVPTSVVARHRRHASASAEVTHEHSTPETRTARDNGVVRYDGRQNSGSAPDAATRTTSPRRSRRLWPRSRASRVDFEMAHRVAEAFSAAPRSSSGARVESAYAALGEQACRYFRFLTSDESRNPIRVVFTDVARAVHVRPRAVGVSAAGPGSRALPGAARSRSSPPTTRHISRWRVRPIPGRSRHHQPRMARTRASTAMGSSPPGWPNIASTPGWLDGRWPPNCTEGTACGGPRANQRTTRRSSSIPRSLPLHDSHVGPRTPTEHRWRQGGRREPRLERARREVRRAAGSGVHEIDGADAVVR